ncbi:MAG: ATP-binding protein [Anaerolineales bacterium]
MYLRNAVLRLSIVNWAVKAHNGAVNVTSAPGEGTTFEVTFPAAELNS